MKNITAAANWCCYYHNTRTVAQTVYFHLDGIMMHQGLFIFRSWDLRLGCLILKKECGVRFNDKPKRILSTIPVIHVIHCKASCLHSINSRDRKECLNLFRTQSVMMTMILQKWLEEKCPPSAIKLTFLTQRRLTSNT